VGVDRELWVGGIWILTAFGLAWGMVDTRRIIEAPFLFAVSMAVIVCPQLLVAALNPWRVPDEAFWVFCLMVVLCTVGLYAGYFLPRLPCRSGRRSDRVWAIDQHRVFQVGILIACIGTIGALKVYSFGHIEEWRGWPVYWYTLSKLTLPGVSLIVISYTRSGKSSRLLIATVLSVFPVIAILTAGRRSMTILLPMTFMVPLLLHDRRLRIPRWTIAAAISALLVVVYAFPYWRSQFADYGHLEAIRQKSIGDVVESVVSPDVDKTLEVIDAMILTGATYRMGRYDGGAVPLYNTLVQHYVPGSLLGHDFKDSLRLGSGMSVDWVQDAYGRPVASYTAKTAFADLFRSFWFAGSAVMALIGLGFRRLRNAALYRNDGRALICLCFFIVLPAYLPYSYLSQVIVLYIPHVGVMLLVFKYALSRQRISRLASSAPRARRRQLAWSQERPLLPSKSACGSRLRREVGDLRRSLNP